MKKDTVWLVVAIVLLLGVVGGLVWIFGGFGDSDAEITDDSENEQVIEREEEKPDEELEEESGDPNIPTESEDLDDVMVDSSVTYSSNSQSVGEDTEELFTMKDVEIKKGEDVMEVKFTLVGDSITEDSSVPVSVVNKSSLGAMEIVVKNVSKDETGMKYDESVNVVKEGITRFTKVVSGVANTVKYNLGFLDAPQYHLYQPEISGDSMIINISIKYPGGDLSPESTTMTEFTSDDVSLAGSTADQGVRISGYSYSVSGGILRYILKTSTNTGSPVPSFDGSISGGVLKVVFPSLNADITYSATGGSVSLPGGVTLNISRSGKESIYEFVGVGEEYKISGVTSPNQVIIEVKL